MRQSGRDDLCWAGLLGAVRPPGAVLVDRRPADHRKNPISSLLRVRKPLQNNDPNTLPRP